jgi:bacillithiol biosynthesis deacetylase BshB1
MRQATSGEQWHNSFMKLDALAFGAHPDDVELTCAGTLIKLNAKGYSTGVVSLTQGELGTRGDSKIRAREFAAAAEIMSVKAHRMLSLPDGDLNCSWGQKLAVISEIRRFKPEIVLAPYWKDRHPDHARASDLVRESSFLAGLSKIDTDQAPHRPNRVIFYPCRYEFRPSFIVDISEFHHRKMQAIQAYESQFHNSAKSRFGETETNISHPAFIRAITTRAKQYGSYIGVEYGEPFLVREPLNLEDPVAFFGRDYLNSFV